ncbi:MAG: hypothetical protein JRI87_12255, partial [Deltaproteobacteria bacterium]|nr:hypothetical protein [Deltaproteobacteria bacterium]
LLLTSMVWFPGRWFDYIVEGYPVIKPDSVEFLVRIFAPIATLALLLIYLLRDRKKVNPTNPGDMKEKAISANGFKTIMILTLGILLGLFIGYFMLQSWITPEQVVIKETRSIQVQNSEFRDFCKRDEIYKRFSQNLQDKEIKIVFSDMFKQGEMSFYSRLKIIESLNPAAIIFLGTYEERLVFLEDISHRSELAFWESRLDKIKWLE